MAEARGLNFTKIRDAIFDWTQNIIGGPVSAIWLDQSGARPRKPYIGLKIIAGPVKRGSFDELRSKSDSETEFYQSGLRDLTLSVNIYGDDAIEIASELQSSLDDLDDLKDLRSNGISVTNIGGVQNLSTQLDTSFEGRAQFDVNLLVASNRVKDVGAIESAVISSDLIKGTADLEDFTVSKP